MDIAAQRVVTQEQLARQEESVDFATPVAEAGMMAAVEQVVHKGNASVAVVAMMAPVVGQNSEDIDTVCAR